MFDLQRIAALIPGSGITIVSVWASTIAGFALSLAAVAGATLIVGKEFLLGVLG